MVPSGPIDGGVAGATWPKRRGCTGSFLAFLNYCKSAIYHQTLPISRRPTARALRRGAAATADRQTGGAIPSDAYLLRLHAREIKIYFCEEVIFSHKMCL